MIFLYNLMIHMAFIIGLPILVPMALLSEKRRKTALPRMGLGGFPQRSAENGHLPGSKRPIWIHALSVGEVFAAVPFVERLRSEFGKETLFFSVSTQTGLEVANKALADVVNTVFFFPYDLPFAVKRIISKVNPRMVVLVESDIWPNFLAEMRRRSVAVALINARVSNRSFRGYRRLQWFMRPVLETFSGICTQTAEDALRFEQLGVPYARITHTGNLKFDRTPEVLSQKEIDHLKRLACVQDDQKVFLAGSTHPGEEAIISEVFSKLRSDFANAFLIIVPRDPKRAGSIADIFRSAGFSVGYFSESDELTCESVPDVMIVDVIGVLRKLYAFADIAFVGGSLAGTGGQNPLEPALYSKPVLFGPDMSSFEEIARLLLDAGGAARVEDAETLYGAALELLGDHQKRGQMGRRAFEVCDANRGAVDRTLEVIKESLRTNDPFH
jgi:3-deoxy-D-manno-octulosonic-acid transferase